MFVNSDYNVPRKRAVVEIEVNKSRFIAFADPAGSRSEALALLQDVRDLHPSANHHCWAYLIGHPKVPVSVAFSDGDEPNGSAGRPILNVLNHNDVGDVMITVARYFGGTKLGVGGLVRAYSSAAYKALQILETQIRMDLKQVTVIGPFALEQALRHWFSKREGNITRVDYAQDVILTVEMREHDMKELCGFLESHKARIADI